MLAAKSQKPASEETSFSISVKQPQQAVEEHSNVTSADEQTVFPALDSVSLALIWRYCWQVREYHRTYQEGRSGGSEVEWVVKLYKLHQRVPETETVFKILTLQVLSTSNIVLFSALSNLYLNVCSQNVFSYKMRLNIHYVMFNWW